MSDYSLKGRTATMKARRRRIIHLVPVCNGRTKAKREVLELKIGDALFLTC